MEVKLKFGTVVLGSYILFCQQSKNNTTRGDRVLFTRSLPFTALSLFPTSPLRAGVEHHHQQQAQQRRGQDGERVLLDLAASRKERVPGGDRRPRRTHLGPESDTRLRSNFRAHGAELPRHSISLSACKQTFLIKQTFLME